jgi:ribosomal protein S18 acetylase RimI-like enzyme
VTVAPSGKAGDVRLRIRAAEVDDIAAILGFWSIARSSLATTDDDPRLLESLLATDSSSLFVAELEDAVVGTAIAAWDGWRGHIYRLAVLPAHRRRGIGRRLVDCGHEWLQEAGAQRVNVAVGENDPVPIAFWLAVGYSKDLEMARYAKTL